MTGEWAIDYMEMAMEKYATKPSESAGECGTCGGRISPETCPRCAGSAGVRPTKMTCDGGFEYQVYHAADYDALAQRLADCEAAYGQVFSEMVEVRKQLAEAKADAGRLREALEDYGMHGYSCLIGHHNPSTSGPYGCTCGLDAALARKEGA